MTFTVEVQQQTMLPPKNTSTCQIKGFMRLTETKIRAAQTQLNVLFMHLRRLQRH